MAWLLLPSKETIAYKTALQCLRDDLEVPAPVLEEDGDDDQGEGEMLNNGVCNFIVSSANLITILSSLTGHSTKGKVPLGTRSLGTRSHWTLSRWALGLQST